MDQLELVRKYFPELTLQQYEQLNRLKELYTFWNGQINVISRKDIDNFYLRHVVHSMAITYMMKFVSGTKILDVGTGGGFPGIPLAILFPDCHFHLVDSIGKKIKVVNEVSETIGLKNVTSAHTRAEDVDDRYDFVVSRAVTRMNKFIPWIEHKISRKDKNVLPNGILYLKGGDLGLELNEIHHDYDVLELSDHFKEEFFSTKKVVYVRLNLV